MQGVDEFFIIWVIISWVLVQESNFKKYKILKFIKISDGIKFLNQMFIFQELYFLHHKKFQSWSNNLLQSSRINVETDFAISV